MASPEQLAAILAQMDMMKQQMASMAAVIAAGPANPPAIATSIQPQPPLQAEPRPTQPERVANTEHVPTEPWRREPRNPRGAFSPGYGVRGTAVDDGPASDLVSEAGTVHRVYPAPTEQSPPINKDDGWPDQLELEPKQFGGTTPTPTYQAKGKAAQQPAPANYKPPFDQTAYSYGENPETPEQTSTQQVPLPTVSASYGGWQPVVYQDAELNKPIENPEEGLLDAFGDPSERGPGGGRPCRVQTCGSPDHASRDCPKAICKTCNHRHHRYGVCPSKDSGTVKACRNCGQDGHISAECSEPRKGGNGCYKCGQDGHMSRDCLEPKKSNGGGAGGFGGGGFGDSPPGACHKCGEEGHWSRECPQGGGGGGGGGCYNCGQDGHLSRDCTEPRKGAGGGGSGTCYNCGQEGHMSRDCAEPRKGGRSCYNCGQEGHTSRECTEPRKENSGRPPRTQDSGWGSSPAAPNTSSFKTSSGGDGWGPSPTQPATSSGDDGWGISSGSTVEVQESAPVAAANDDWGAPAPPPFQNTHLIVDRSNGEDFSNGRNDQAQQAVSSDSWDAASAPSPAPPRMTQSYINPDRLRMMGRGGAPNGAPRQNGAGQPSFYERDRPVPLRQDNGWASRSQSAALEPAPPRESAPPPAVDDGFGGW